METILSPCHVLLTNSLRSNLNLLQSVAKNAEVIKVYGTITLQ